MTTTSGQIPENKRLSRIALYANLFVILAFVTILILDYNGSRHLFAPPEGMVQFVPVQRQAEEPSSQLVDAPEIMNDSYLDAIVQVLQKDGVVYERHGSTLYVSKDFAKNRNQLADVTGKAKELIGQNQTKLGALGD